MRSNVHCSRTLLTTVAALALCGAAVDASAESWREQLSSDLVRVEDGKMRYEQLSVCEFRLPDGDQMRPIGRRFQTRSKAEAPAEGLISRDQFVALVTQLETRAVLALSEIAPGLSPTQAIDTFDCDPIAEAIGKVDLQLLITLTMEGIQLEFITPDGASVRSTHTWAEYD